MQNQQQELKAEYLFEVCWEVCNQIGGINTVLKTKVPQITQYYGDSYCLIGPYFEKNAKGTFKEENPPEKFKTAFTQLRKEGIKCHYGKWLVKGEPKTILIDFFGYWGHIDDIKKELWQKYGIDTLNAGHEFDEPTVWAYATGRLLEKISPEFKNKKTIYHFHEWPTGPALLYLKKNKVTSNTVFTTHATILGRTLAHNNEDLYTNIEDFAPEEKAYEYGVAPKHQMEKQTAQECDIFTTVSKITAIETENLLKRPADVILANGLSFENFATFEEMTIQHRINRSKIRRFILYYFFPYYTFDIENTYYYFLASRYEYHNKGMDSFIKSLGQLNEKLKKEGTDKTIVTFFWVPSATRGIKSEIIEAREIFKDIEDSLEEDMNSIQERALYNLTKGKIPAGEDMFEDELVKEIQRKVLKLKRKGTPPLATHDLEAKENEDSILQAFYREDLTNKEEDPVKVIFYPLYLTGNDGLLNLNYHECIQGSHLGVFPSFYEPWGYTPLETAALGVVSTTTDTAGFGRFVNEETKSEKETGVFVLERMRKSQEEIVNSLTDILYEFQSFSHQERVRNKIRAREIASLADWDHLIGRYIEAYNKALDK